MWCWAEAYTTHMHKNISYMLAGLTVFFLSTPVMAQAACGTGTSDPYCLNAAAPDGVAQQPIEIVIANLIQIVLGFVGVIFITLIIYAGFKWMVGGRDGNEKAIEEAKTLIRNAVIGLIVIVSAYSITFYLATYVLQATGFTSPDGIPSESVPPVENNA